MVSVSVVTSRLRGCSDKTMLTFVSGKIVRPQMVELMNAREEGSLPCFVSSVGLWSDAVGADDSGSDPVCGH